MAARLRGPIFKASPERRSFVTKRVLVFAYGVLSYALFLATFLYAVGFIGGFAVPTRLDGATRDPLAVALAVDVALLTAFALQHSGMARKGFKDAWTRFVPPAAERSTYVLFSSLALLLMFWQWRPIGGVVWSVESGPARAVVWSLFAFGWLVVLACTFFIDHFDLFGLRQVWLFLVGRPYTGLHFVTPGPYRLVRHPLYVGWLFAFWATPTMTAAHLVFALATTAYILIAIRLEERDLVREHGTSYEQYRRAVPMLWPFGRRVASAAPADSTESAVTAH
jgi:protein-S-isoprenylcysteine O-methyltransferase Ste14